MRKLINSTYITLDGVIENPQDWPSLESDETSTEIQVELLLRCDTLIMGRRTYEGFAPVWSSRSGDPFSEHINAMDKWVVSSTLRDPEWNNTRVIAGDPVSAIVDLKNQPGGDIVQYGFGQLSHALMAHGQLDELRLWIYPFFIGQGGTDSLLYRDSTTSRFTLLGSRPLSNGIVVLSYQRA
jgi:dihydrofolate reductase